MGKILIWIGAFIAFIGVLIWVGDRLGVPFGKLPGDFSWTNENSSFYFPLGSSILISLILTLLINLAFWIFRK